MKTCSHCQIEKPENDYHTRKASPDGLAYVCIACAKILNKESYLANKEKYKIRAKLWAKNNPDRRKEISKKSDAKNKQRKKGYSAAYMAKKKSENIDAVRAEWRFRTLVFRKNNKEKVYSYALKRRSLASRVGAATSEQIKRLLGAANNICGYCGKPTASITIDHIIPVARGGSGGIKNLFPACKSCNSQKHAKEVSEWLMESHGIQGLARAVYFMENGKHVGF